jgi:hypothetical protein
VDAYLVDGTYELFRHYYALPSARDEHGREVAASSPNQFLAGLKAASLNLAGLSASGWRRPSLHRKSLNPLYFHW